MEDKSIKKIVIIVCGFLILGLIILLLFLFVWLPSALKNTTDIYNKAKTIQDNLTTYVYETTEEKYPLEKYDKGSVVNATYSKETLSLTYITRKNTDELTLIARYVFLEEIDIESLLEDVYKNDFSSFDRDSFSLAVGYSKLDDDLIKSQNFKSEFPSLSVSKSYICAPTSSGGVYYFASIIGFNNDGTMMAMDRYQYAFIDKSKYDTVITFKVNVKLSEHKTYFNFLEYLSILSN